MPLQFPIIKQPTRNESEAQEFLESCHSGDLAMVQESLEHHQPPNTWLSHGHTEAAKGDQPAVMKSLLERGATIQTWSVYAAKSQLTWELLLNHGLEVNNSMPWALVSLM